MQLRNDRSLGGWGWAGERFPITHACPIAGKEYA